MPLVDGLRARLDDPSARSFQLMGEDLAAVGAAELATAAAAQAAALSALAPPLRDAVAREERALADEAHAWLRRHNRSVATRVAGYLELGRRCRFQYPWPVVAILGICQVMTGLHRNRLWGVLGHVADRLGWSVLDRISDGSDDILRRTNRGIFADSVPVVLRALHADHLRRSGHADVAGALIDYPALLADDETRALARGLYDGLALPSSRDRFAALADLTLRHFEREQAIFSYHLGPPRRSGSSLARRLSSPSQVPAPAVVRRRGRARVEFRPYPLPPGFDLHDHRARVDAFGAAFVSSVVADLDDYRVATAYVIDRFGAPGEHADLGL